MIKFLLIYFSITALAWEFILPAGLKTRFNRWVENHGVFPHLTEPKGGWLDDEEQEMGAWVQKFGNGDYTQGKKYAFENVLIKRNRAIEELRLEQEPDKLLNEWIAKNKRWPTVLQIANTDAEKLEKRLG